MFETMAEEFWKQPLRQQIITVILDKNSNEFPKDLLEQMRTPTNRTQIKNPITDKLIKYGRFIKQWSVKKLYIATLTKATAHKLLNVIKPINFLHLQILSLRMNNIQSIEGLSRINAPILQEIRLSYNKIHNISQLRKFQSEQITTIYLNDNKFSEASFLTQANWQNIKTISIQAQWSPLSKCQSIEFISKINHCNPQKQYNLYIASLKRIDQKFLLASLLQKYSQRQKILIETRNGPFKICQMLQILLNQ